MDWTTNNESEHNETPEAVDVSEMVSGPESAHDPEVVSGPEVGNGPEMWHSPEFPRATSSHGSRKRTALILTGGLVLVAAIGGSGFVIGHYVGRPASSSAFGNFPDVPNFRFQFPGGASGSFGNFPGGSTVPTTLPAHSPSAATAASIAAKVNPGVVDISTTSKYQSSSAAGTGMVLTSNGLVLTNNHVINGATSISVRLVSTGTAYNATVLGYSVSHDVALLQLHNASGLATVTTADSSTVSANQPIVAIGNAGGVGGTPSVAPGAVVATNQSLTASDPSNLTGVEKLSNMIQVAADIQPGDSGGPLVNTQGQVIGMDTAGSTTGSGFGTSGESSATTQGYAIPINTALSIVHTIERGTSTASVHVGATPILGVEISATLSGFEGSTSTIAGVQIAALAAGTPAAASRLAAGDIITAINGQNVSSPTQLSAIVQKFAPGDTLKVSFTTLSGTSSMVNVTLVPGPAL
ncbi:MAG: trypsin-like peptidase domain-containing protein [Actinomycetota bacterium]|nr:trypsin-like peptidase domain-containing protein [Actinomycetota bacterium]